MAIVVVAHLHAREGKEDEAQAALEASTIETHGESGCLLYALHRGLDDPREFTTIEKWESAEALEAHLGSPHIQTLLAQAEELLDRAPDIRRYDAILVGGPEGVV